MLYTLTFSLLFLNTKNKIYTKAWKSYPRRPSKSRWAVTVSYLLLLDARFPIKCQNSIDSSKIHVLCFLNQIINNRFDFSKLRVHCFLNQIINNRFDSSKMHVICFLKYIINNSWTWTFFEESIIFWHLIGKLAS